MKGVETRPVPAADAVTLMQTKTDQYGNPEFNEDTYLDEDRLKSIFSSRRESLIVTFFLLFFFSHLSQNSLFYYNTSDLKFLSPSLINFSIPQSHIPLYL